MTSAFKKTLAKGVAANFLLKLSAMILVLATTAVLARLLGSEKFGQYTLVFVILTFLVLPINSGLGTLLIREIAALKQRQHWSLLRGLLIRSAWFLAGWVIFIGMSMAIAIWMFADKLDQDLLSTSVWALLVLPFLATMLFMKSTLISLHHVVKGQLPEMIIRPLLLVLFLLFFYWIWKPVVISSDTAMAIYLCAVATSLVLSIYFFYKHLPPQVNNINPEFQTKKWVMSLLPLTLLAGIQIINTRVDIVMLGLLTTNENVGVYRIATQGGSLTSFMIKTISIVIAPYIAKLYASGDHKKLQRLLSISALIMIISTLPIAAILIFGGKPIINFVFGADYERGALALTILSIGHVFSTIMGPAGLALNMMGHERSTLTAAGFGAVLNVVLNIPLIIFWGIEGAAIATATSLVFLTIYLMVQLRKKTGFSSSLAFKTNI